MRSERQALTDIAKLCDVWEQYRPGFSMPKQVRAILADVQPAPAPAGGTIDRDVLDAKDHGIDCSSIEWAYGSTEGDSGLPCDCWKSLVRPVEGGVVLTREEAKTLPEILRFWVYIRDQQGITGPIVDRPRALAERLEAAS